MEGLEGGRKGDASARRRGESRATHAPTIFSHTENPGAKRRNAPRAPNAASSAIGAVCVKEKSSAIGAESGKVQRLHPNKRPTMSGTQVQKRR